MTRVGPHIAFQMQNVAQLGKRAYIEYDLKR